MCYFHQAKIDLCFTTPCDGIQTHLVTIMLQVQTVWELNWQSLPFCWFSGHQRELVLSDTQATSFSPSPENHHSWMQVGQPSEFDENGQEKWYKVHEGERVFDLCEVPTFMQYIRASHFIPSIILIYWNELNWWNIWNMLDIAVCYWTNHKCEQFTKISNGTILAGMHTSL